MELLIPGLILVALMVYASTRIKKIAAAAFEPETIETEAFVIQKPEGFLNVLNGDPQFEFEAYSKEFGNENFRRARAHLRVYEGISTDEAVANLSNSENEIASDVSEVIGEVHYRVIETRRTEKGLEFQVFYKIAEKNAKVSEFEIAVLAETEADLVRKAEAMLDSFELK